MYGVSDCYFQNNGRTWPWNPLRVSSFRRLYQILLSSHYFTNQWYCCWLTVRGRQGEENAIIRHVLHLIVFQRANIIAVQVLGSSGSGSTSGMCVEIHGCFACADAR